MRRHHSCVALDAQLAEDLDRRGHHWEIAVAPHHNRNHTVGGRVLSGHARSPLNASRAWRAVASAIRGSASSTVTCPSLRPVRACLAYR